MKIAYLLFLFSLISCGSKNNIFYDGKSNNSDTIGNILPAEVAPDLVVLSPEDSSTIGKNVTVTGNCSEAKTIIFTQDDLINSPVSVNCEQDKFSANLNFQSPSNKQLEISVKAINIEKTKEVILTLNIDTSSPTVATHIDVAKTGIKQMELSWNKADGSSTLPLKGYVLEFKRDGESSWSSFSGNPVQDLNATIENLEASTLYNFRVRASNGNYSDESTVTRRTLPDNDFFKDDIKAFNIAGATASALVAIEDGDFYLNGNLMATLQAGEVHNFSSAKMDKISSSSAFYVAGRKGSGSDNKKGNIVWTTQDWADTKFSFSASRSAGHDLSIAAFEDINLTIKNGTTTIETVAIAKDSGSTIRLPNNGNYQLQADGVFSAYLISTTNSNNQIQDPRPILPNSTDIIGIPSRSGYVSASTNGTVLDGVHSNDVVFSHTFTNLANLFKVSPEGTGDRYKALSVRIKSDKPIQAVSTADADGYGSAPFLPRAKMKNTYALNVETEWLALASISAGSVEVTKPNGTKVQGTLTRSGSNEDAPYKLRMTNLPAGSIIKVSVKAAAWYEPKNDNFGANNDETLLFGFNL